MSRYIMVVLLAVFAVGCADVEPTPLNYEFEARYTALQNLLVISQDNEPSDDQVRAMGAAAAVSFRWRFCKKRNPVGQPECAGGKRWDQNGPEVAACRAAIASINAMLGRQTTPEQRGSCTAR